jgi:acetyl/propionyl-CoA carboxylase alpha subunit
MDKLLIANRGEIARRIIRAARGLGIKTAVVYSDADADALFVQDADESVRLEGNTAAETYLCIDLVLEAARRVGADAIHPGYGFLSENAEFAQACVDAGLTFVGPPPAAIRSMGDKVTAKMMMTAAGVPTLSGVTVTDDTTDLAEQVAAIGLPAIVKASAGGGGRGMRVVDSADELLPQIDSARREAIAAFGDGTVFVERYLSPSRHIEVQVIADDHGNVATLFERECSIQRRHQKVVEEAPSPFVDAALRAVLVDAAEKAARAVDYRGVGTVEFVVGADGTVAFLEMNTRLQVEHPVTEMVTGLDLVRLQLTVADGEPLPPDVLTPRLAGHAIEVRLCAEDPNAGYLPASGTFDLFELGGEGIRVDTGVQTGSEVSPYYDSMVAKVIAHAGTRSAAASLLADALERARLHGVRTNRDMLVRVLRSAEFLAGDTTTDFVDRVPGLAEPRTTAQAHQVHAVAAALALHATGAAHRPVQPSIPAGWRNNRSRLETVELKGDGDQVVVGLDLTRESRVEVDGRPFAVDLHRLAPTVVDATVNEVRRRYQVLVLDGSVLVDSVLGSSRFDVVDPLPIPGASGPRGGLTAPMPGLVVRVLAQVGDVVEQGRPLVVLEAMKMEHTITSPHEGTVTGIAVSQGDQVERGAVLAEVRPSEGEDPS